MGIEMKHTPGIWRQSIQINSIWITDSEIDDDGEDASRILAMTNKSMGLSKEARANARLIAAAPELLEALIKCEAVMTVAVQCMGQEAEEGSAIQIARAAIAKATGKELAA